MEKFLELSNPLPRPFSIYETVYDITSMYVQNRVLGK